MQPNEQKISAQLKKVFQLVISKNYLLNKILYLGFHANMKSILGFKVFKKIKFQKKIILGI